MEARNLNPPTPFFITYKSKTDKVSEQFVSISNDAEIKILETAVRRFGKQSNIQIHTDRITCEYCQETIFRNNHGLRPYIQEPEPWPEREIENIQAYGYLLYQQEGLNKDLNFKDVTTYLKNSPANQQLPGCEGYR